MPAKCVSAEAEMAPDFNQISESIKGAGGQLWRELTAYIEETYGCRPKVAYSSCAAKPGWNVKYHKSGKSLCTLYPEEESFTALVVIGSDIIPQVEATLHEFGQEVGRVFRGCTLFNGTYWMMIKVDNRETAGDIKRLLLYKLRPKAK